MITKERIEELAKEGKSVWFVNEDRANWVSLEEYTEKGFNEYLNLNYEDEYSVYIGKDYLIACETHFYEDESESETYRARKSFEELFETREEALASIKE